jgi:hypothetical protein
MSHTGSPSEGEESPGRNLAASEIAAGKLVRGFPEAM